MLNEQTGNKNLEMDFSSRSTAICKNTNYYLGVFKCCVSCCTLLFYSLMYSESLCQRAQCRLVVKIWKNRM